MYDRSGEPRQAPAQADQPAGPEPRDPFRLALERVRAALQAYTPGMPFDADRHRAALAVPGAEEDETERLFGLGWLHWLNAEAAAAEPHFAAAAERARAANNVESFIEASYWQARAGLQVPRAEALAVYETALRSAGGLPRATAWFVDLLWRSGRVERAEQVLKTVRGNRRFAACDEVPLLEARVLLRKGDLPGGERLLQEAVPAGAAAQAERWLLLAWVAASQNRHDETTTRFQNARRGLYPAAALEAWQQALARHAGPASVSAPTRVPVAFADFVRGQEHRLAGRNAEAVEAYRAALNGPAAAFAAYALARTGQGDYAALLAAQPGLFLALRCRLQLSLERFLRREASTLEVLDAVEAAASVGHVGAAADHFRALATTLRRRDVDRAAVRDFAATPAADPAARRNYLRAALELADRRLAPADAASLLEEWRKAADAALRPTLERQLLRQQLLAATTEPSAALQPLPLVASLLEAPAAANTFPPAASLWFAARAVAAGWIDESRRLQIRELAGPWRPLAQALLLHEAAARKEPAGVAALLDAADVWEAFGARPPRFVVAAVEHAITARPDHAGLQQAVTRWLQRWPGTVSDTLADRVAGRSPPPGVAPAPWFLYQAARAVPREDYAGALSFLQRALDADPATGEADAVRAALPELEHFARARALAEAFCPDGLPPTAAGLLVDAVDLLLAIPEGVALVDAAAQRDRSAVDAALSAVVGQEGLSPRLAHHLALLDRRAAEFLEGRGRYAEAVERLRRGWGWWLGFLAAQPPDGPEPALAGQLADTLLGGQRRAIHALLSRDAVDDARRYWDLVGELPARARRHSEELEKDFATRIVRFRDELATDFLLATREAMRQAPAPEGFRADYNAALVGLRRLLSLDRDNQRLLVALVETCVDWFFDLYNAGRPGPLAEQVDRFTPFAVQLARRVDGRPGDLAARVPLAAFTKFRGFVTVDPTRKAELYREALQLNPADANVRDLIAQLEARARPTGD